MGLLVSETSLKEACEGRDTTEVVVVKPMVAGDGVSPHHIPHTEIVEGFVKREVGTGTFKDTLRGGIWSAAVPNVAPRAGGSPPDIGIEVDTTLVRRRSVIIAMRHTRVVALVLLGIGFGRVARHLLALLVSDEGDDEIVSSNHHPLYNLPLGLRHQHSSSAEPSAHEVQPQQLSQIMMPLQSSVIGVTFTPTFCIGDDSRFDSDPHSFLSFSHVVVPLCSIYSLGPSHDSYDPFTTPIQPLS